MSSLPSRHSTAIGEHSVWIGLKPGLALIVLLLIVCCLVCADLIEIFLRFRYGLTSAETYGFIRLFDLNREANVPTWFSSILLIGCAALLSLIAAASHSSGEHWTRYWAFLSIMFVAFSLDEIASFHEASMTFLYRHHHFEGLLTNAWVILAIPLLLVLFIVYLRFLLALPSRSRRLFLLSAGIYLGGVVVVEMFSGLMKDTYGFGDIRFALMTTFEETLEMVGLSVFIYALMDHMTRLGKSWTIGPAGEK